MNTSTNILRGRISAVLIIVATYFYFLIFAEFAFLERVRLFAPGIAEQRLAMLALGLGGIVGALGAATLFQPARTRALLAWTLRGCAAGALLSLVAANLPVLAFAAAFSGAALGALTVIVASSLRGVLGATRLGLGIGVGTGLAYALCNIPGVFHASAATQTVLAILATAGASGLVHWLPEPQPWEEDKAPKSSHGPVPWTLILLALVWLDSAAFYIIQHTPQLRAVTWENPQALWLNAGLHLAAALVSGLWLDLGHRRLVASIAVTALGVAVIALDGALPTWLQPNWLYVAGVSFYSVALVEIPARSGAPRVAAGIFAVAGWLGSALGIGMAQDLTRVPPTFVAVALGLVAFILVRPSARRVLAALLLVGVVGFVRADEVQRGREVYIAEGCIHCHSQYVREQVPWEVLNWGPATSLSESLAGSPPLFGTRRQGPDLARVGNRRSLEWNRLHLISPQAVSPGSRMPSYAHLFAPDDARGDALLAYLASLGAETMAERQNQIAHWTPREHTALAPAAASTLFQRLCTQCHGKSGEGDGPLATRLSIRPPNWTREPWRHLAPGGEAETQLYRIIKFGLPGLPMAGHEYLSDSEVVGLARYVQTLHKSAPAPRLPAPP